MEAPMAELRTVGEDSELRFERRLEHPPERVWRALTDSAELAHWFPAAVEPELRVGGRIRFTFSDVPEEADAGGAGEVTEYDPPRVFAFRWGPDLLRFELSPDGPGCLLVFTQKLGGGRLGRLTAARNAYGWDVCFAGMEAWLTGKEFEAPCDGLGAIERYVEEFGLAEGEVGPFDGGFRVCFTRDLMWSSLEDAWRTATEGEEVQVGAAPPVRCTNTYVYAGLVTGSDPPRTLEYVWLHGGELGGTVRWEFLRDPDLGTRVELTQTVPESLAGLLPTALAAWQVHLELFFAALNGDVRRPWPEDRTKDLHKHYAARLG